MGSSYHGTVTLACHAATANHDGIIIRNRKIVIKMTYILRHIVT